MHRPHPLLEQAIDYAGLFPPASLSMPDAVREYGAGAASDDAWALGRFVVPADRLDELAETVVETDNRQPTTDSRVSWRVAVIGSGEPARDLEFISAAERKHGRRLQVEAYEVRATEAAAVRETLNTIKGKSGKDWLVFLEIPLEPDPAPVLESIREYGGAAKFRTGGTTPEAFPDPGPLLRAFREGTELGLRFKCTAGLHHPVRGRYRLTYAEDSGLATMFGYLNVLVAGAGLRDGWPETAALGALLEENPAVFRLGNGDVTWRDRVLGPDAVSRFRREGMLGFGSCSFQEPMDELGEIPVL